MRREYQKTGHISPSHWIPRLLACHGLQTYRPLSQPTERKINFSDGARELRERSVDHIEEARLWASEKGKCSGWQGWYRMKRFPQNLLWPCSSTRLFFVSYLKKRTKATQKLTRKMARGRFSPACCRAGTAWGRNGCSRPGWPPECSGRQWQFQRQWRSARKWGGAKRKWRRKIKHGKNSPLLVSLWPVFSRWHEFNSILFSSSIYLTTTMSVFPGASDFIVRDSNFVQSITGRSGEQLRFLLLTYWSIQH